MFLSSKICYCVPCSSIFQMQQQGLRSFCQKDRYFVELIAIDTTARGATNFLFRQKNSRFLIEIGSFMIYFVKLFARVFDVCLYHRVYSGVSHFLNVNYHNALLI